MLPILNCIDMFIKIISIFCIFLVVHPIYGQNNTTNATSPCTTRQDPCAHICTVANGTAVCMCNQGWYLHSNGYSCVECQPGTFGHSCLQKCNCGQGNGCSPVNGTCLCNSCWSGSRCDSPVSSNCFRDFLLSPNKSLSDYGNQVPLPANAGDVLTVLRQSIPPSYTHTLLSAETEIVSNRPDGVRELLRVTVGLDSVNFRSDSVEATASARTNVKIGTWRCTLVSPDASTWIMNI